MKRVGVIGDPVKHSRSPVIFAHWFERYHVDAEYCLIPIEPSGLEAFFADFAPWTGVNVTLPHKEAAARFVTAEGAGERLGVVNTIWRDGDTLRGTSSDGMGFVASLNAAAPDWRGHDGPCVIIGAGGASIAVADALAAEGRRVIVANRTPARAEAIAARTGAETHPLGDIAEVLAEAALLVNATSMGMNGQPPLPLDLAPLPAHAVVADIVYNPLRTPLLEAAEARGLKTVDGLGMLLHQATMGFEKWFGHRPAVDAELRAKVVRTL